MLKKIVLSLLSVAFTLLLFLQVQTTQAVAAPITSPITVFNLVGHVTFKNLGMFAKPMNRILLAETVFIKVTNFFNPSQTFNTTTDANGDYKIKLPDGFYEVEASDSTHTFFVPPLRVVNIRNATKHANFQGLIFP